MIYSRKWKQGRARPHCINDYSCVGRGCACWNELNQCIMVSDRGISGVFLQKAKPYQLQCSSPEASIHTHTHTHVHSLIHTHTHSDTHTQTHKEASRQTSLFPAIWLAFKRSQKQGICQLHLCLCQLLSTYGNIWFSPSFAHVPVYHRGISLMRGSGI